MKQKTAIVNPKKQEKILAACRDESERNLIVVLLYTGMHIDVYCHPGEHEAHFDGDVMRWKRPKTGKWCIHRIENVNLGRELTRWLNMSSYDRKSRIQYWRIIKKIGKRAGFPDLSPATLRHTFCYNDLRENGDLMRTKGMMQCSLNTLSNNYMLVSKEDLKKRRGGD